MISDCVFCFVLVSVLNSVSNSFRDLATALGSADSSPSRGEHVAVAVCAKAVQLMADRKLRDRHKLQRYVLSDLLSSHLQQFPPLPETVPQLSAKYYLCGNSYILITMEIIGNGFPPLNCLCSFEYQGNEFTILIINQMHTHYEIHLMRLYI